MTAHAISASVKVIIGAIRNTPVFAPDGMIVSLRNSLSASAKVCISPKGPTTFGPRRNCIDAHTLRSAYTAIATPSITGSAINRMRMIVATR